MLKSEIHRDPIDECRQRLTVLYSELATIRDHHTGAHVYSAADIAEAIEACIRSAEIITDEINGRLHEAWKGWIVRFIRNEIARKDRNVQASKRRAQLHELSHHLVMAIESDMPKRRDIDLNTTAEPGCVRLSFAANLPADIALKVAHAIASIAPEPPPLESLD